ncbi:YicC/YloC family endoribonuclease [Candidatus Curculioniphilus buchneri]|uniref:YicC/YloC family endoribonuclease n=1 Tax=Candidatus Curculioniphilus buchneri TaxID=690594 RepID=UPI00376ED695
MVYSMTAFTQYDIKNTWGNATWEIRSTNCRYLDTYIRLPEQFHCLEPVIHDRIYQKLTRGKIECHLHFNDKIKVNRILTFNKMLAMQLIQAAQWIKIKSNEEGSNIDLLAILAWPGVMNELEQDTDVIREDLLIGFNNALNDLINARKHAGNMIKNMIQQRLVNISTEINKVRQQIPKVLDWQRKRLLLKIEEARIVFDHHRLEQELLALTQKIDITEELDRLEAHIQEMYQILTTKEEPIGRRLDFMMQELNRESNTLGAKSIHISIIKSAIELKVFIEQMREQIQNIE